MTVNRKHCSVCCGTGKTHKGADCNRCSSEPYTEEHEKAEFMLHASRAFFASAWADMAEEENAIPWPPGAEIMAYMPDETDPAAAHAAETLMFDIERENGKTIGELMGLIERDGDGDRPNTVEMFGHYAAMQAMGHGVGIADAFGSDMRHKIKIPYVEFSQCSLEKDYFTKGVEA